MLVYCVLSTHFASFTAFMVFCFVLLTPSWRNSNFDISVRGHLFHPWLIPAKKTKCFSPAYLFFSIPISVSLYSMLLLASLAWKDVQPLSLCVPSLGVFPCAHKTSLPTPLCLTSRPACTCEPFPFCLLILSQFNIYLFYWPSPVFTISVFPEVFWRYFIGLSTSFSHHGLGFCRLSPFICGLVLALSNPVLDSLLKSPYNHSRVPPSLAIFSLCFNASTSCFSL